MGRDFICSDECVGCESRNPEIQKCYAGNDWMNGLSVSIEKGCLVITNQLNLPVWAHVITTTPVKFNLMKILDQAWDNELN
jgi:hypothetical protein